MNKTFYYSILKYIHSQFLGEELNLGIVLFFPDTNSLIFKYPENINRLKKAYRNFSEAAIKSYLRAFKQKAQELSEEKISGKLEDILERYFLLRDSSTLQFSEVQAVVQYDTNVKAISGHYFRLYFPEEILEAEDAGIASPHIKPVSDQDITKAYEILLIKKDENLRKYLKEGIELRNAKTHFKSDLVWENGTVNAVKGLSFDLKDDAAILDKSVLVTAQLNYLQKEALAQKIRFDLLISRPQNPDLYSAYSNALITLTDITVNKKIVTEEKLQEYVSFTSSEIEKRLE